MTHVQGPSIDNTLLVRIASGDAAAFARFVAELQPMIYRWALTLADDPDDADDLVQETFLAVHRKLHAYDGSGTLAAWLYGIARRTAAQRRRIIIRRKKILDRDLIGDAGIYLTDPGARVDRARAVALIRAAFKSLPRKQREVFDLVDLQGLTPAEAAELTGGKAVTVRAHLFKARAAIRSKILSQHPLYDA